MKALLLPAVACIFSSMSLVQAQPPVDPKLIQHDSNHGAVNDEGIEWLI